MRVKAYTTAHQTRRSLHPRCRYLAAALIAATAAAGVSLVVSTPSRPEILKTCSTCGLRPAIHRVPPCDRHSLAAVSTMRIPALLTNVTLLISSTHDARPCA